AKVGQEAFSGNQIEKVKIPATITEFGSQVFANNQRWVVLEKADGQQALPDAVRSTKYDSGFGQVVAEDAVSITINYIDADTNKPLRSPQVLQSEFTEPDGVYFAGEENTIKAPQLAGYAVTPDSQKITPQAGEANEVTFKYKKTDFSPTISGKIVKHIAKDGDGSKKALLEGVTATDTDGNDITDSLTVSPESIDTSVQEATYDVYYTAKDSKGRTKTVKGKVAVGPDWPEKTICPGWQVKDFKYHTWTDSKGKQWNSVAGFSTTGLAKYRAGKTKNSTDWCWPTIGDKGQPIDSISEDAFRSTPLTSVPDSWGNIEYIGMRAFLNSKLTALPDSWGKVKTIQYYAFQNNQLTALPKSWGDVSYLGNEAFRNNKITALEAPWGKITKLSENVFSNNQIASLPDSWGDITSIGRGAFSDNRLTALPDSWGKVSTLGQSAFYNNKITALKAPWGNITTLPTSVFENNLLTSLPASWGKITTIGNKAFSQNYYNKSESMVLPDSWGEVTSIGDSAFENNPNTTLPASWGKVSKVGSRAFKNNKLKTVPNSWGKIIALPESVFEKNEIS
ncbi:leucine-rich repeat domain-containing protein, partial [Varibaculum cambriense]|uniref:leucine-rich repeat domain-containing protein n=1 Tax=Varibaculum cambriense TaxID=184870 RepID=UPI00290EB2F6